MEKESKKGADSRRNDIDDDDNQEATAEVLEKGDIFFFDRPKTKMVDGSGDVKSIEDIRRFFMVTATTTAPNTENEQKQECQKDSGQRSEAYMKIHRSLQVSCYQMSLGREMLPGLLGRENMR